MMLIAELEHRTHNLLAVVDALAEQTLLSCGLGDFQVRFRERLATLSRVQGLLSRVSRLPGTRGQGVEQCACLGRGDAFENFEGPEVALPNSSVQILALGLHELATNARKHGALGAPSGSLAVRWRVKRDGHQSLLVLSWAEDGIASRRASNADLSRVGLGRTLIEKSIPYQLDAQTRLEITHDTVRCDVTMALDRSDTRRSWDALR
jgi:two-component sensor histidine kinase